MPSPMVSKMQSPDTGCMVALAPFACILAPRMDANAVAHQDVQVASIDLPQFFSSNLGPFRMGDWLNHQSQHQERPLVRSILAATHCCHTRPHRHVGPRHDPFFVALCGAEADQRASSQRLAARRSSWSTYSCDCGRRPCADEGPESRVSRSLGIACEQPLHQVARAS